jgi:hypothetical protein
MWTSEIVNWIFLNKLVVDYSSYIGYSSYNKRKYFCEFYFNSSPFRSVKQIKQVYKDV